jgi:hypothetical protein
MRDRGSHRGMECAIQMVCIRQTQKRRETEKKVKSISSISLMKQYVFLCVMFEYDEFSIIGAPPLLILGSKL